MSTAYQQKNIYTFKIDMLIDYSKHCKCLRLLKVLQKKIIGILDIKQ